MIEFQNVIQNLIFSAYTPSLLLQAFKTHFNFRKFVWRNYQEDPQKAVKLDLLFHIIKNGFKIGHLLFLTCV